MSLRHWLRLCHIMFIWVLLCTVSIRIQFKLKHTKYSTRTIFYGIIYKIFACYNTNVKRQTTKTNNIIISTRRIFINDYYIRYSITWMYYYKQKIWCITHIVTEFKKCSNISVNGRISRSAFVSSAVWFIKGGYYCISILLK